MDSKQLIELYKQKNTAKTSSSPKASSKDLIEYAKKNYVGKNANERYNAEIQEIANLLRETPDRVVVGEEPEKVVPDFPKIPTSPDEGSPSDMLVGAEPSAPLPVVPGQEKKYVTQNIYDAAVEYNRLYDEYVKESNLKAREAKRKNAYLKLLAEEGMFSDARYQEIKGNLLDPKDPTMGTVENAVKDYGMRPEMSDEEGQTFQEYLKANRKNTTIGESLKLGDFMESKGIKNYTLSPIKTNPIITTPEGDPINNTYTLYKYGQASQKNDIETKALEKMFENPAIASRVEKLSSQTATEKFAAEKKIDANVFNVINGHEIASLGDDNYKYTKLTDAEKKVYNYLVLNQTTDMKRSMAEEYLYSIDARLEQEVAKEQAEGMNGFEKGAYSFAQGVSGAVENIAKLPGRLGAGTYSRDFRKNLDFFYGANSGEYLKNAIIEGEISEDGEKSFAYYAYSALNSLGDQVVSLTLGHLTGGAGKIASGLAYSSSLSSQIVSDSIKAAMQDNKSKESGVLYGAIQAAMEVVTDRMLGGIGSQFLGKGSSSIVLKVLNAIDDKVMWKIPKWALKTGLVRVETAVGEALQEWIQGYTDPSIRYFIYDVNKISSKKTLEDAFEQSLIGGICGFLLSGGFKNVQTTAYYEAIGESLTTERVLKLAQDIGNTQSKLYQEVLSKQQNGKEISNELIGQLSQETLNKMYKDNILEVELLKYIAQEGTVQQIAGLMFDGDTKSAEVFKQKYTDETFLNNLDFEAIDKGNVANTFNEYLDSPTTARGFESIGANESVNEILKLAEQNGATDTETYNEVMRLKNNRQSIPKELKGRLMAEIKSKQNGRNQTAEQVVYEEAVAKKAASSNTVDGTTPPPTAGKVLKMNPISANAKEYVKGIAQQLGTNLEFVNMAEELSKRDPKLEGLVVYPEGFYDPKTKTLYVGNEVQHPVEFVFKHELTHHGEVSSLYDDFAKAVRGTKAFAKWLETQATYTAKDKANKEIELHDILNERYKNVGGLSERKAQREVIANFVGDMLFNGDVEALSQLVEETTPESKNAIIRYIADFFKWLKSKFTGNPYISREVRELEAMYKDLIADANVSEYTETDEDIVYDEAMSVSESNEDSKGRTLTKAQQRYFAKSKARDKYGRLLVLYHGSDQGGFTIFDPKKSEDKLSLFLTTRIEMAESYSGSRNPIRTPARKNGILGMLDRGTSKGGKQQGVYTVYANIKNPLVIDAKGHNFNRLSINDENTVDVNFKVSGTENDMRIEITKGKENTVKYFSNFDEAMAYVNSQLPGEQTRLKGAFLREGFVDINSDFLWNTKTNQRMPNMNIREIAAVAKKRGYDGVIVNDVTDYDNRYGMPEYTPTGTVVVAFKPNQIKEVTNKNPGMRDDIRYSMPGESVESVSNNGQKTATKTTKNIDGSPKKSYSYYNEFATNVMIWEKSASTKPGDAKIFNFKNSVFVLMEATENGSIEVARGKYKEVKAEYERAYAKSTSEIHGNFESYGIEKGRDIWDLQHDENRGDALGDNAKTESQELQTDTSGNNEYLRTGDKGKQNLSMSMPATDRAYLDAVENGDMETAQRMVDEAAKKAGYDVKAYHGTPNSDFTQFDYKKIGSNTDSGIFGRGFYFTTHKDTADVYATEIGTTMPVYLQSNNPWWAVAFRDVQEVADKLGMEKSALTTRGYGGKGKIVTPSMSQAGQFSAHLQEHGYDSVVVQHGKNNYEIVVFDSNQIKSADPVTYDDNGNVIPLSQRFNKEESDIRFSVASSETDTKTTKETATDTKSPISKRSLYQKVQSGEMTFEEFTKALEQLGEEKRKQYGTIPDGEMVTETDRPVNAPKKVAPNKNLRRHVRTILEGNKSNEVSAAIKAEVLAQNKGMVYEPDSNEKQAERARKDIANQGYNTAKKNWLSDVDSINAQKIANGEALLRMADEQNNVEDAVELTAELAVMMTTAGQALQAAKLFKRMGSIGRLIYMQRFVNKINRDLSKRYKNAPPIVINEDLAGKLLETKTEAEAELVIEALKADIGKQMPANFLDKWNAWRYVSMLFNPTTHIRNFVGNGIFTPVIAIKEYLSAAMQSTVGGVKKDFNKTTTFKAKKRDVEFAKKDFEKKKEWLASSGKYDDFVDVSEYRTIFTSKVGKPAEYIRKKNSELLEKEDVIFLKLHYVRNLARYLTANKIDPNTASRSQLDKAREYAAKRAWEYTFRDASRAATAISKFARDHKAADVLVNSIMPFKKTPINIFKRGVEYSPIGFLTTIGKAIRDLRSGDFTAAEFIDGLASNITGTGLFVLGMILSNLGVIRGGFDDEDKWFNKLLGEQEYSLQFGDFSYTINWAAPSAMPLFMGATFNEMEMDENSNIIDSLLDSATSMLEPFVELSMLQGINDVLTAVGKAEEKEQIWSAGATIITNYFMQGVPTILGKFANLIDDTRRTKYLDYSGDYPVAFQAIWDTIAKKLPFLSMDRAEYIDAWGREEYTGDVIERFFQQFVSPGYASTVDSDAISEELRRLKDKTGESSVYPDSPNRYVMVGSTKRHLTKEEYYNYAVTAGQTKMDLVNEVMNSKYYDKLTDESKAEVIKKIYGYSEKLAKASQLDFSLEELREMYGKNADKVLTDERWNKFTYEQKQYLLYEIVMGDDKKAYQYAQSGGSVADYYILRRLKSQD